MQILNHFQIGNSLPAILAGVAVLWMSCTLGEAPDVQVDVDRQSWEQVNVSWQVTGSDADMHNPEVSVFDASYDTLYSGPDASFTIPDAQLGNRERVLIEVCGQVEESTICTQEGFTASPKRAFVASSEIAFPADPSNKRGRYEVDLQLERQQFDGDSWEQIDASRPIDGHLKAYVGNHQNAAVQVPIRNGSAFFDLSGRANTDDFAFHLRNVMDRSGSAVVNFDLYAGVDQPEHQASFERVVQRRSDDDRLEDLQFFAKQAADQLLERLSPAERPDSLANIYVHEWEFDGINQVYEARLDVRWGDTPSGSQRIEGVLVANENGEDVSFEAQRASRLVHDRWMESVDGVSINLSPLQTTMEHQLVHEDEEEEDSLDLDADVAISELSDD